MSENNKESAEFDSSGLLFFMYQWRKPLIIIFFVSLVASVLVSSLITPRYKSTVILFPTRYNNIAKSLVIEANVPFNDLLEFGKEQQAEQMLQILTSDYVMNRINAKYDLMKHYGISPKDPHKFAKLKDYYRDNVTFSRTQFMSVKISVMDVKPELAASIANDIAALLDSSAERMVHHRARMALNIVKNDYNELNAEIDQMEDSMAVVRKLGVLDYKNQVEELTRGYGRALATGNTSGAKQIEEKLKVFQQYGKAYNSLYYRLKNARDRIADVKIRYEQAKVDAKNFLPFKYVVDKAHTTDKKAYPIRWLVVLVSVISSLLLGIVIILIINRLQRFSKLINNE